MPEYIRRRSAGATWRAVVGHFWFAVHEHVGRPWTYVTLLRDPVERVGALAGSIGAEQAEAPTWLRERSVLRNGGVMYCVTRETWPGRSRPTVSRWR